MKKYLVALVLLASASSASAANILVNGDFETGTLAGWANATGRFYADNNAPGGTTPASSLPTPYNPNGGTTFAVGDQTGGGATVLSQSFTVGGAAVTISFDWFNNIFRAQR